LHPVYFEGNQWNSSSKKVNVIMLNVMLNIKRLLQ
jgi:hypothetical protein